MPRARNVLYTCAAALLAWSFAQGSSHSVALSIPEVAGIRIIGAGSGPRSVLFDYSNAASAYLDAVNSTGVLLPTSVNRFSDVELFVTGNGQWSLRVVANAFTQTSGEMGPALDVAKIVVRRGTRSGLVQNAVTWPGNSGFYLSSWSLSTTQLRIASSNRGTGGWRSLGFSGLDYEFLVDGNETSGSHVTTVTYLLTRP